MTDDVIISRQFVWQKKHCKGCGKRRVALSTQGFCDECGLEKVKKVCHQLQDKRGYWYKKYKRGLKGFIKKLP